MKKENIYLNLQNLSDHQLNELEFILDSSNIKGKPFLVYEYGDWIFVKNHNDKQEVSYDKFVSFISWVETKEKEPIKNANVHFVIRGYEDMGCCGYFDGDYYWNKGEAYDKEIVSHFQYISPKKFPVIYESIK